MELPEGTYRIEMERFNEFSPCQDGGIAANLFEHGNAGWGYGRASLNNEPLYENYEIRNDNNHPDREVFDHFFAMELTWKN